MKLHTIKDALNGLPCNLNCLGMIYSSNTNVAHKEYPIIGVSIDKDQAVILLGKNGDVPMISMELAEQLNSRSRSIEIKAKNVHDINPFFCVVGLNALVLDDANKKHVSLLLRPLTEAKKL